MSGGCDGVTALYIDDKLIMYGDYYHDKIDDCIRGFVAGLRFANVECSFDTVSLDSEHELVEEVSENGGVPPENYKDIKF
jgi:hypothetical protein